MLKAGLVINSVDSVANDAAVADSVVIVACRFSNSVSFSCWHRC